MPLKLTGVGINEGVKPLSVKENKLAQSGRRKKI